MFLRAPQLIRPVMVWYEFKGQKLLILVHEIKKQAFRLGETTFLCIFKCYVMMKLAQPARRPCNRPGFPHAMSRWSWHSLPDDLTTDLDLHRTSKYNQRQTFIQVNDVETKNLIALPADICWCLFFSTATVRVLPGTVGDLECPRCSASTTWTHIVLLTGASLNAHGLCVSRPCEQEGILSKTSKTGTHRDDCTYPASSHER